MAGGMLASVSQAPVLQQHRRHPADTPFTEERHAMAPPAWPLRFQQVLWECFERGHPVTQGPVCTGRPHLASQSVSSSGQVATDPSPAWLPHCVSRKRGILPRRADEAKLPRADPHHE